MASFVAADHACAESSIDCAFPVPIALLPKTLEYDRALSGGLVVTLNVVGVPVGSGVGAIVGEAVGAKVVGDGVGAGVGSILHAMLSERSGREQKTNRSAAPEVP